MAAVAAGGRRIGSGAKIGLGLIGCVIVFVVYYLFFFSDLSSAVNTAKQREGQLRSDQTAADLAFDAFMKDSTELQKKIAKARDLNKVLPETSEVATFLAAVNQQAEVAGLKVKSVTPADEATLQFYTRVPVKLEVSGRFHQVAKFFGGVGRLDRIINVENIEMGSPKAGDNDETTLDVKCLTTTFHTNPPKPVASASSGAPKPGPAPQPGASK